MTIGDEPELLAVGFLLNQNMLRLGDKISGIEYEDDLDVVVVRTDRETDFEKFSRRKRSLLVARKARFLVTLWTS